MTLTELVVVITLASVVTIGLVTFYFHAQSTWIDASTQAMAQREATGIVKVVTDEVRRAQEAHDFPSPDSLHEHLALTRPGGEQWSFWWDETDSLIHQGPNPADDHGPIGDSKVETFELRTSTVMVWLTRLRLRSANGQPVELSTSVRMMNHS